MFVDKEYHQIPSGISLPISQIQIFTLDITLFPESNEWLLNKTSSTSVVLTKCLTASFSTYWLFQMTSYRSIAVSDYRLKTITSRTVSPINGAPGDKRFRLFYKHLIPTGWP